MAEKNSVAIADALAALAAGEAIVYPTETFYALGVDALSLRALDRLFAIKGREPGKPVALIAADTAMAFAVAREVPAQARVLAQAFWPGPLTLVLPARAEIPARACRRRRRSWRACLVASDCPRARGRTSRPADRDQRQSRRRAAGLGNRNGATRVRL